MTATAAATAQISVSPIVNMGSMVDFARAISGTKTVNADV
jgi:hypothetical protein